MSVDALLDRARTRLERLEPAEAFAAVSNGAVLIDIRPVLNRATEGVIPGAVVIDRNVLEWRLEPGGAYSLPLAHADLQAIVFCNEGYASSFAADSLRQLGVHRATDLVGGYRAWRALGLPTSLDA